MRKSNSIQKKLQEIFSEQKLEELEIFKNSKTWKSLDESDRSLLASLFVMLGEKQFNEGDRNAEESLDLARKVSPENCEIFFKIGNIYSSESTVASLKKAEDSFKKTLNIKPDQFRVLVSLGNVYNTLGLVTNDLSYFYQAQETFSKAFLVKQEEGSEILSHFYWHWGVSFFCLGKHSGEAVDFHYAVDKFEQASKLGLQEKTFWNSYGDALAEMAILLSRNDLFFQVIELYRNAVRQSFDFFPGWLNLACVFQRLYEIHLSEDYFNQACECFKMASQIYDGHPILWLKWAQLQAAEGKLRSDITLIKDSFEKFAKADACDPKNPLILGLWGEALLLCGAQIENIELLRKAEEKIVQSLEINSESSESWYIYGSCLYELGRYFNQESYYHEAVAKFQFGLSIKQNDPLLWYGLAITCYAIGELKGDLQWIEKSNTLFSRVLEFKGHGFKPLWNDWAITLMKLAEITNEKSYLIAALDKFAHIIPADPEQWDDEINNPEWLYNYGCALDFLGDFTEDNENYEMAIQALAKVVQIDPEYTNARYNLALSLAHLAELARDVECFHKSIEQFQILLSQDSEDELAWSDYGLTIMHLAQLIYDNTRPEQSQKLFEIAEGKFIQSAALGNTQAFYHLACLHSLQGDYEGALHYLERAEGANSLPSLEQLLHDEWLEGVRGYLGFRNFINHLSAKNLPDSPR